MPARDRHSSVVASGRDSSGVSRPGVISNGLRAGVNKKMSASVVVPSDSLDPLAAKLVEELTTSWRAGNRVCIEDLLARCGASGDNEEIVIPLLYEELCLREEHGESVDHAQWLARFPQFQLQLEMLLDCHQLLTFSNRDIPFPEVGETFGEFCLTAELGRGAAGRVFLANQPSLSDRPVVLKVTAGVGEEHLSLSRLQHSGIVPVYFVQELPERGLRGLCMPYLGGVTLERAIESLCRTPVSRRSGKDFVELLMSANENDPDAFGFRGPAIQFLSRATYMQAVCWIGACLADALHYAHQRGLLHLDVKPSNVLLASDGQPMLLDFHLARRSRDLTSAHVNSIGGTRGYMSPEQQTTLDAIRAGGTQSASIDERTDIYSLGVLLSEMLGDACTGPLAEILDRCREHDPNQRYVDGESLAADLRACLVGSPSAPTPDLRRALPGLVLIGCLLVGLGYFAAMVLPPFVKSKSPSTVESESHVAVAAPLRRVVDELRLLNGPRDLPRNQLDRIDTMCGRIWEQRETLAKMASTLSSPDADTRIGNDLTDLAILWSDLRIRLADSKALSKEQVDSVARLQETERLFGLSPALCFEIQRHAATAGMEKLASEYAKHSESLLPHTAWSHYSHGRSLLRAGELKRAYVELAEAVELAPDDFWSNFYAGTAAFQLTQYDDAIASYSACVALAHPTSGMLLRSRNGIQCRGPSRPSDSRFRASQTARFKLRAAAVVAISAKQKKIWFSRALPGCCCVDHS